MKNLGPIITDFASSLYQKSHSTLDVQAQHRNNQWLARAFLTLLSVVLAAFVFYFYSDAAKWYQMQPEVVVEKSDWTVLLDPASELPLTNSPLWAQAKTLTDPAAAAMLKEGAVTKVWLRLVIPAVKMQEAAAANAYYLRLGWLIGSIRVWVDDQALVSIPSTYTGAIDVALPVAKFETPKQLSVLIAMTPRPGAKNLTPLTMGVKGGLVAYPTGAAYQRFNHFINRSRPLALFFVYTVFAAIFFLLWTNNRVQREYFHLATFALVNAMPELLFSDAFTTNKLHDASANFTYLCILLLKASTGLTLGLAFSRTNIKGLRQGILAFLVIGVAALTLLPPVQLSSLRQTFNQLLIPAVFFFGAIACFVQAIGLRYGPFAGRAQPKRVFQLYAFAGVLTGLSAIYYCQFHINFDYVTKQLLLGGLPDLSFVLFLGYLALANYREQTQLVEKIPISSYHRRAQLPERLFGAVVMLDLKNSEKIYTLATQGNDAEAVIPTILSHIWTSIQQNRGTILKADGDEVIAFFDSATLSNPLQAALETTDKIAASLRMVEDELRCKYDSPALLQIHFRAGISLGEIRPIWVGDPSSRLPSWNQVGEDMVFVDAARLMEIEKQLESTEPASRVLLQSALLQRFPLAEEKLQGNFLFKQKRFLGKHDRIYLVNAYQTIIAQTDKQSRAA